MVTKQDYIEWLNDLGVPEEEYIKNGGRIPNTTTLYGAWIRKNDPIAFNVGFREYELKH